MPVEGTECSCHSHFLDHPALFVPRPPLLLLLLLGADEIRHHIAYGMRNYSKGWSMGVNALRLTEDRQCWLARDDSTPNE